MGMCLRDNTAVCMGCAVHPIIKHAMQASRSYLEVLSSKQMLLPSGRDAHLCQRPGRLRYHHVLSPTANYLASPNELAKENRSLNHFRRRYTVRFSNSLLDNEIQLTSSSTSASVAACFRLSHTVAFANTTDTMYLIGPLLFWACGEMTCGFFILSVPCLSKLIIESGLPRSVKQSLGFGSKPSEPSYEDSEQPHRSGQSDALRSHPMRPWLKGTDTIWSKIGDEDHDHDALRNSGKSESQTSLHRAQADGRN